MLQKTLKVLASSVILTSALSTTVMTNNLSVHAETVIATDVSTESTTNNYEQREFVLPATGSYWDEAKRERRGEQKTFMPTGIYVKPNETVTIEVSGTQKIRAIIGTHQYDKEWGKEIELSPGITTVSSPNGGLLGFDNFNNSGTITVKVIQGGSPVPFFELGKHTKEDWIAMMNAYPNAHAVQLKSKKAVLTVTYDSAKKYIADQNPIPLLEKYDEMISVQDKISGLSDTDVNPLNRTTKRIWAFVENPNNATGLPYMYASLDGAVFPTDNGAIVSALNVNEFGWGQFHEHGHGRQQFPWTWGDLRSMTEVTVNLYSLASQKKLLPNEPTRLEKEGDYARAFDYLKQPVKDYKNIDDLFVKLVMLWQLHLAYGDNFYPNLHKLYRELPDAQLPKTDDEKIQAFIYNTSKVAGQNLLPFFDQWGLKETVETRSKIEALNLPLLTAPIWEATDFKPVTLNTLPKENMKVIASSEELGVEPATNAIDGNPFTIWHSKWSESYKYPTQITIDLGENRIINQLSYLPRQEQPENGRILSYNVYTSTDGIIYQKVASGSWENNKKQQFATFEPIKAKYVKLEVLNGVNGYASAAEIDILSPVQVLAKDIMKVTASSEELGIDPAIHAIDGNPDTIWHSKWSEPNKYPFNLTIDIGETRKITQLAYIPRQDSSENGRILNYNIYTSTDGINYQKAVSGTWENSKKQQFATFEPVSAKYVKLEVVNGTNGYASVGEVDIVGY